MRLLLPLVLLAGCASTKFLATNAPPHQLASHTPAQVELLRAPPQGRGYTEIGVFDLCDPSYAKPPGEDPKVATILRAKGAKLGCDAVQVVSQHHVDDGLSTREEYRARCLVWQ